MSIKDILLSIGSGFIGVFVGTNENEIAKLIGSAFKCVISLKETLL